METNKTTEVKVELTTRVCQEPSGDPREVALGEHFDAALDAVAAGNLDEFHRIVNVCRVRPAGVPDTARWLALTPEELALGGRWVTPGPVVELPPIRFTDDERAEFDAALAAGDQAGCAAVVDRAEARQETEAPKTVHVFRRDLTADEPTILGLLHWAEADKDENKRGIAWLDLLHLPARGLRKAIVACWMLSVKGGEFGKLARFHFTLVEADSHEEAVDQLLARVRAMRKWGVASR